VLRPHDGRFSGSRLHRLGRPHRPGPAKALSNGQPDLPRGGRVRKISICYQRHRKDSSARRQSASAMDHQLPRRRQQARRGNLVPASAAAVVRS
jgi:hypothetical protein